MSEEKITQETIDEAIRERLTVLGPLLRLASREYRTTEFREDRFTPDGVSTLTAVRRVAWDGAMYLNEEVLAKAYDEHDIDLLLDVQHFLAVVALTVKGMDVDGPSGIDGPHTLGYLLRLAQELQVRAEEAAEFVLPGEEERAAARKAQAKGMPRGQKSDPEALPEETGEARDKAGEAAGVSGRSVGEAAGARACSDPLRSLEPGRITRELARFEAYASQVHDFVAGVAAFDHQPGGLPQEALDLLSGPGILALEELEGALEPALEQVGGNMRGWSHLIDLVPLVAVTLTTLTRGEWRARWGDRHSMLVHLERALGHALATLEYEREPDAVAAS